MNITNCKWEGRIILGFVEYVYMHLGRCSMQVCMQWSEDSLRCQSSVPSIFSLQKGLSLAYNFTKWATWLVSKLLKSTYLCFLFGHCWDYRHVPPTYAFHVGSMDQNSDPHTCMPSASPSLAISQVLHHPPGYQEWQD